MEIKMILNQRLEEIEVHLQSYHYQNGGDKLPPTLRKRELDEYSDIVIYDVCETTEQKDANSSITLAPHNGGKQTLITVNLVDPARYAIVIDDPQRGMINSGRLISLVGSSERCALFCNGFIEYLQTNGFVKSKQATKGKRESYPENQWAFEQLVADSNSEQEVFEAWIREREIAGRSKGETSLIDLFRKSVVYPARVYRQSRSSET
jgi:hypothetical protein